MGSLIFEDIVTRHVNQIYDFIYLRDKSQGLNVDSEFSILKKI